MPRWLRVSNRLTVVLLVASLVLILPGTLGFGAGLPLFSVLAGLGLGGYLLRSRPALARPRLGVPIGRYLAVVWLGPVVAGVVVVVSVGATPAEVQAFGGLVGLVAMLNYFLRPVYYAISAVGRWVGNAL